MRALIIVNLEHTKFVQQDDSLSETASTAKRFSTILEADSYAMWLSHVLGIPLYATTGETE